MNVYLKYFVCVALVVIGVIFNAYALTLLWGWFITPTFNVAVPSVAMAAGITLFKGSLFYSRNSDIKAKTVNEMIGIVVNISIVVPLVAIFVGWIITLFL